MQEIFEKIRERLKELGWVFGEYYPDGTEVNKRTDDHNTRDQQIFGTVVRKLGDLH